MLVDRQGEVVATVVVMEVVVLRLSQCGLISKQYQCSYSVTVTFVVTNSVMQYVSYCDM